MYVTPGDLKMGSAHKDLATKMLEASKMSKASDTQIVKVNWEMERTPWSSAHVLSFLKAASEE